MQSRFLYTHPITPVAGKPVDVFYNPDETALRGRPEVYLTASYNRGTHPGGCLRLRLCLQPGRVFLCCAPLNWR